MFLRGGEVWRQRYLVPQRQYMWYLYYTPNLGLYCILSCYQGDNYSPSNRVFSIIRLPYKYRVHVPERPALADIIAYFLAILLLIIHFFVYSVLFGYEREGSPQYYCFISFVYLAIRTLGTLPRTWAPLRDPHRTEHHSS